MSSNSDSIYASQHNPIFASFGTHRDVALLIGAQDVLDPVRLPCELRHRPLVLPHTLLPALRLKVRHQYLLYRQIQHHTANLLPSRANQLDMGRVNVRLTLRRRQHRGLIECHHTRRRRHGARVVDHVVLLLALSRLRVEGRKRASHRKVEGDSGTFGNHGEAAETLQFKSVTVRSALVNVPPGRDSDDHLADGLGL
jgi:hypothetical protein